LCHVYIHARAANPTAKLLNLTEWLAGLLAGWLVGWLAVPAGWLAHWLASELSGWLAG